jgi:general secretion pathway protein D
MSSFLDNRCWLQRAALWLLFLAALTGCVGQQAFLAGQDLMEQGRFDEAVAEYALAVEREPAKNEFRVRLYEARQKAAQAHLQQGRRLMEQQEWAPAAAEFGQAAGLDPSLETARLEQKTALGRQRAAELTAEAEQFYRARKFVQARNALDEALQLYPASVAARELLEKVRREGKTIVDGFELDITSDKPITLKFKDADIRDAFTILSRLSGINFIFDEEIRAQRVTVLLEDGTFPQALELLLNLNKLGKKVLNSKTIIIYPKAKDKEKQYEDQLIQTFYLSNVDAKKAVNLLRTMLQLRKVYVHEELNALVVRDTPEVIKLCQQIIEAADRPDSEVVFDLELIEVNHTDDLNLGPKLSTYSVSAGLGEKPNASTIVGSSLSPGAETGNLVKSFSRLESFYTLPTATFDLLKKRSDAEILANPQIRVKNKEKAKVHIGTREPVITVTRTGGTTGDFSENVQYIDVGVKLDVEPNIQLDQTVVTKLNLEVSSVSGRQTTGGGSQVITITTTNAQTGLTLKDGERTVFGGLIRDDISKSKTTIPFLGDLPLVGDLITSHTRNKTKREILLSITPHIVKQVEMPRPDVASIWSGGEDSLKAGPNFAAFAAAFEPVTEQQPPPAAPALQPPAPIKPPLAEEAEPLEEPLPLPPVVPQLPSAPALPAPAAPQPPVQPAPPAALPPALPSPAVEAPSPVPLPLPVPVPLPGAAEAPAAPAEPVEEVAIAPLEIPPAEMRVFMSGPAQVAAGQEFTVEVAVSGAQNLYSAPLFVTFSPEAVEFVRAEEGNFLGQGGQTTVFTSSAIQERGQVIVGYKQGVGGAGVSGEGRLFLLTFRGRAAGQAALGVDRINFRDPSGNRLPATTSGLTVEVR